MEGPLGRKEIQLEALRLCVDLSVQRMGKLTMTSVQMTESKWLGLHFSFCSFGLWERGKKRVKKHAFEKKEKACMWIRRCRV